MTTTAAAPTLDKSAQTRNLILALAGFAITFWAWNLIGPLAVSYTTQLGLTATQKSLLVAMPVLVGSVGRIPVGALTDRYGGRVMFTIMLFVSIVPVLLVCLAGTLQSYTLLLVFGFFLSGGRGRGCRPDPSRAGRVWSRAVSARHGCGRRCRGGTGSGWVR